MPDEYRCTRCGAAGVRLWRDRRTSGDDASLLCSEHVALAYGGQIDPPEYWGDRIGYHVAALPDTIAPTADAALSWWLGLPFDAAHARPPQSS